MVSDEHKKKKKSQLPFRLNILFLVVFLAFSLLILRLGVVQIVNGEEAVQKLRETQQKTAKFDEPRGKIHGRFGKVLVGNKAQNAIIFTRRPSVEGQEDTLRIAKKLAGIIDMSKKQIGNLSLRDKKDYYILTHPEIRENAEDQGKKNSYQNLVDSIKEKELPTFSKEEKEIIAIKHELDMSSNLTPHVVVSGLSTEEMGRIAANLSEFNGLIRTDLVSDRIYPNGKFFYLGELGPIPRSKIENYLARGYNRNDRVGRSGLELYYQELLKGMPTKLIYTTHNNMPVGVPKHIAGNRGYDLRLTINLQLQKRVGEIIEKHLRRNMAKPYNDKLDSAFAVVMNPNTGAILALAGKKYNEETGEFVNAAYKTVLAGFESGSTIKGATVLAGFQTNSLPGTILDKPILGDGFDFSSWTSRIPYVNAKEAIQWSSNVYMGFIAANMAGFKLDSEPGYYALTSYMGEKFYEAFNTLRDIYGQFGLGVSTGVDLPTEALGYQSRPKAPGNIIQFAIGQYDTYTPLMLAQYVSTIANGGYRIAPHFLKSVHLPTNEEDELGPKLYEYELKIMNHVENTPEQIELVQEGFRMVTQTRNGTASVLGMSLYGYDKYNIAAKTGTAQTELREHRRDLTNSLLVAYAPYDNPQVAVSVVVPDVVEGDANTRIGGDIIKAFFELKQPGSGKDDKE